VAPLIFLASASNGTIFEQHARELNGLPVAEGIVERAGKPTPRRGLAIGLKKKVTGGLLKYP
jgi:hypothetical protein